MEKEEHITSKEREQEQEPERAKERESSMTYPDDIFTNEKANSFTK